MWRRKTKSIFSAPWREMKRRKEKKKSTLGIYDGRLVDVGKIKKWINFIFMSRLNLKCVRVCERNGINGGWRHLRERKNFFFLFGFHARKWEKIFVVSTSSFKELFLPIWSHSDNWQNFALSLSLLSSNFMYSPLHITLRSWNCFCPNCHSQENCLQIYQSEIIMMAMMMRGWGV